ncbi:uncharacterized protein LOC131857500 [Cryptomeria japonica]|uniref:uncharacterized protein LOC131857500 n=1 Tax=Cryptomeria japonica TaxID=3369 RepID=UPI0027DA33EA|nr:uncharacterized protein LOC131857500 [Cryptomeria japonica]
MDGGGDGGGESSPKFVLLEELGELGGLELELELPLELEFITRTQGIVNHLRTQGETISDHKIVEKVLRSLPPKFDPVVIAIDESKDLTTFKVAELIGSLQSHEECMQHSIESFVQAFRKKKSDLNKSKASYVEESSDAKNSMFFAWNLAKEPQEDVWFLDSCCLNHMTGKSDFFAKLDDSVRSKVIFGDDKEVDVMGKGTLAVKTKQGDTTNIHNTFFVPELQHSLLSIGQLLEKNYKVVFEDSCYKSFDKSNNHHLVAKTYT